MVAVAITSNTRLAEAPGNVLLKRRETRLKKDSVANVSQVITLDKSLLTERAASLRPATMEKVSTGLRLALSL